MRRSDANPEDLDAFGDLAVVDCVYDSPEAKACDSSTESSIPRKAQLSRKVEQIHAQELVIRRLRTELTAAEKELQSLYSSKNSLQPISFLPEDLLQHVFEIVCDARHDERYDSRIVHPIRLSHVCRRWRELTISTPTLWACVPLHNPHVVAPFIARSRAVPLYIELRLEDIQPKDVDAAGAVFKQHSSRIHGFKLFSVAEQSENLLLILPRIDSDSLRTLQYLHLDVEHWPPTSRSLWQKEQALEQFCMHSAPPLKEVNISNLHVSWKGKLLADGRLTHLRLTNQTAPELDDLLSLLRDNPLIEELGLLYLTNDREEDVPDASTDLSQLLSRRVELRCLHHLHLDSVDLRYDLFLAKISASSAAIVLGMSNETQQTMRKRGVISMLSSPMRSLLHLPAFQGEEVYAAAYSSQRWYSCTLTYYRRRPDLAGSELERQYHIEELHDATEWGLIVFTSIGKVFPLPHIRALHLTGIPSYDANDWHQCGFQQSVYYEVLAKLPSLLELRLEGCALPPILRALFGNSTRSYSDADRRSLPLPRLTTLEINVDMECGGYEHNGYLLTEEVADLLWNLVISRAFEVLHPLTSDSEESVSFKTLRVSPTSITVIPNGAKTRPVFDNRCMGRLIWLQHKLEMVCTVFRRSSVEGSLGESSRGEGDIWEWMF